MNEALIGLLGAIFGGVGIKIVEGYILPRAKQEDIATQIRDELRGDIAAYKEEVASLRSEVDDWKRRYFVLIELLIRNNIEVPEHLFEPYKRDPSTPNIQNRGEEKLK